MTSKATISRLLFPLRPWSYPVVVHRLRASLPPAVTRNDGQWQQKRREEEKEKKGKEEDEEG
jgi:hypothetical protein